MLVTVTSHYCAYLVQSVNPRHKFDELCQSDWDFPALARAIGWKSIKQRAGEGDSAFTSREIQAAQAFIDRNLDTPKRWRGCY